MLFFLAFLSRCWHLAKPVLGPLLSLFNFKHIDGSLQPNPDVGNKDCFPNYFFLTKPKIQKNK